MRRDGRGGFARPGDDPPLHGTGTAKVDIYWDVTPTPTAKFLKNGVWVDAASRPPRR